jgi:cystathionine beta-synthase
LKPEDVVVILFHDHATRYMGKAFNDEWMKERGFLENKPKVAIDLIDSHSHLPLLSVSPTSQIQDAIEIMEKYKISQLPVLKNGEFVGSLNDNSILGKMLKNPNLPADEVVTIMESPFPVVDKNESIEKISSLITKSNPAVVVKDLGGSYHIITKYDLIGAIAQ